MCHLNEEIKNKIVRIKEIEEKMVNRRLIYESRKYVHNFQHFETVRSFSRNIFTDKNALNDADKDKSDLLIVTVEVNKDTKGTKQKIQKTKRYL